MADKINIELKLDGEKEFASAIKTCNAELKNMTAAVKEVDATTKGSANSQESLAKKVEALGNASKAAKEKVKTLEEIVKKQKAAQEEAAKALTEAKKKHGENSAEVAKAEKAYINATNGVNKYEAQLHDAVAQEAKINDELKKNEAYLDEAKNSADGCAHSIDELGKETKETTDETSKFHDTVGKTAVIETLQKSVEAFTQILAPFGAALDESREKAEAFETAIAKVSTIASRNVDITKMSDEIRVLSREFGISADEIAESTYQAISASVDTADAVDFVRRATKLSIGGFTDSTMAVDVLTTAINAYGMETEAASKIADTLITTQKLGKTTVDELAQSIGQVIPIAANYGVSIDDISSAYVTLTRNGINTANATTYIRGMIQELGKTNSKVSKILKNETGKSFAELIDSGQSLGGVIGILSETVNGDATAFANLWGNVRAAQGAMSILNAGTEEYDAVLKEIESSLGAADEAYEKMADTSEMSGARMEAAVSNFQLALGESMEPAVVAAEEAVAGLFDFLTEKFEELPEEAQMVIGSIAAVGSKAAEVAPQVMNFVTQIATLKIAKSMSTGMTDLTNAISGVADQSKAAAAGAKNMRGSFSALKGAIGPVTLAIAAATAAIMAIVEGARKLSEEERKLKESTDALADGYEDYQDTLDDTLSSLDKYNSTEEKRAALEQLQAEALAQKEQAQKAVNDVTEKATSASEMWAQTQQQELSIFEEIMNGMTNGAVRIQGVTEKIDNLSGAQENANGVLEEADADLQRIQEALAAVEEEERIAAETITNAAGEVIAAKDASISKVGEELAAWNNLDAATQQTAAAVAQACGQMLESITSSITSQIQWLDTLAEKEKLSADTLAENLRAQIDAVKEWEANLAYLANQGINEKLLQYLADMGPQGSAYVQAFVDAANGETAVGIDEMNALWMEKLDLESGINEEANNLLTSIGEMEAGSKEAFAAMAESLNAATNDTGQYIVAGLVSGIQTAQAEAEAAAEQAGELVVDGVAAGAQTNSPSKATIEVGKGVGQGLINGIQSSRGNANKAAQELAKGVINAIKNANMQNAAATAARSIGTGLVTGINAAKPQAASAAAGLVMAITTGIQGQTPQATAAAAYLVSVLASAIAGRAPQAAGTARSAGANISAALGQGISAGGGQAIAAMRSVVAAVASSAGSVNSGGAYRAGFAISEGMARGIQAGQSLAIRAAQQMALQALNQAKATLKIKSPSKVFEDEVGAMAAEGFALGFNNELNIQTRNMIGTLRSGLPDMSQYGASTPAVYVYVGDKELSAVLSTQVVKEINGGVRAYAAAGGRR